VTRGQKKTGLSMAGERSLEENQARNPVATASETSASADEDASVKPPSQPESGKPAGKSGPFLALWFLLPVVVMIVGGFLMRACRAG
jgi:hypothetical protein